MSYESDDFQLAFFFQSNFAKFLQARLAKLGLGVGKEKISPSVASEISTAIKPSKKLA